VQIFLRVDVAGDLAPLGRGRDCYVTFQMAEVVVSPQMSADIVTLIAQLWAPPAPA
jgi:hypothetical protein